MPNSPSFARAARPTRLGALLFTTLALAASPRPARADQATAEALFKEGRRLFKEGKLDEACPKLAESQRLDPSSGTLLNLAACHEEQGKLASAWAEFLAASRLARSRNEGVRAQEATRRASVLEPKLSTLTVRARADVPGLAVKRNGELVEAAQLGVRLPVDPGEYVITAEAPGRAAFRATVIVKPNADGASIEVPPLAAEPSAPPPPAAPAALTPATPAPAGAPAAEAGGRGGRARPVLGYVAGGVGLAALGVGVTFGVMALSNYGAAEDACPGHDGCSPGAIDDRKAAGTQAWVANAGIGVGLVGVALGGYLLFIAPPKKAGTAAAPPRAAVALSPRPGGLALHGSF